jgi:hypothetical protein
VSLEGAYPRSHFFEIVYFGAGRMLDHFSVVFQAADFGGRGTLIHAYDGEQLVMGVVTSTALEDYFSWHQDPGSEKRALVVQRNMTSFKQIMAAKYKIKEFDFYEKNGVRYPKVTIVKADMRRSGLEFTDDVLAMAARAGFAGP